MLKRYMLVRKSPCEVFGVYSEDGEEFIIGSEVLCKVPSYYVHEDPRATGASYERYIIPDRDGYPLKVEGTYNEDCTKFSFRVGEGFGALDCVYQTEGVYETLKKALKARLQVLESPYIAAKHRYEEAKNELEELEHGR